MQLKFITYLVAGIFSLFMSSCSDHAGMYGPQKDYVYGALMTLPDGNLSMYETQIAEVFMRHGLEVEFRRIADSPKVLFFTGDIMLTISGGISEDTSQLEYGIAREHDSDMSDIEIINLGHSISKALAGSYDYRPLREFLKGGGVKKQCRKILASHVFLHDK